MDVGWKLFVRAAYSMKSNLPGVPLHRMKPENLTHPAELRGTSPPRWRHAGTRLPRGQVAVAAVTEGYSVCRANYKLRRAPSPCSLHAQTDIPVALPEELHGRLGHLNFLSATAAAGTLHQAFERIGDQPIACFKLPGRLLIILSDPVAIKEVM